MNDKTILTLCITFFALGILISFFLDPIEPAKPTDIEVSGIISAVHQSSGVTIATITPSRGIPVVFFEDKTFERGEFIRVRGSLQNYEGKLELIAKNVVPNT